MEHLIRIGWTLLLILFVDMRPRNVRTTRHRLGFRSVLAIARIASTGERISLCPGNFALQLLSDSLSSVCLLSAGASLRVQRSIAGRETLATGPVGLTFQKTANLF